MNIISWPDHLLTLDEFVALPEDKSAAANPLEGAWIGGCAYRVRRARLVCARGRDLSGLVAASGG
ncbi:hypothetical protein [Saccharopolyspora shandongensis]|uniref:hypothetical protein n=1 Tax=Saccharopolyspora shandongensis TaxID=418495 RepID=UPI000B818238|nr:hypothetical protein [Saccharopolyspora shandongensis]